MYPSIYIKFALDKQFRLYRKRNYEFILTNFELTNLNENLILCKKKNVSLCMSYIT